MDSLTVMEGAFNDLHKNMRKHKRTVSREHCNKEILVNVVVEQSAANDRQQQMVRMLGFVMLDEIDTKLTDVRLKMMEQLDDEQLHIVGVNFKFLNKTFPISSKQESLLSVRRILMDFAMPQKKRSSRLLLDMHPNIKVDRPSSTRSRSARSKKDSLVLSPSPKCKATTINLTTNSYTHRENPFLRNDRSIKKTQTLPEEETDDDDDSEPGNSKDNGIDQDQDNDDEEEQEEEEEEHVSHGGGDYDDDDDDDDEEEEEDDEVERYGTYTEQVQTLEAVPHHYQYMSARRQNSCQLTSPVVSAVNHPSSSRPASVCGEFLGDPTANAEYRQVKLYHHTPKLSPASAGAGGGGGGPHAQYTIMVRANHSVLDGQHPQPQKQKPPLSTVFTPHVGIDLDAAETAGSPYETCDADADADGAEDCEERSEMLKEHHDDIFDDEHLIAPRMPRKNTRLENTRLEVQCGEKLPRIRSRSINHAKLAMAHEVGGLLSRSQVSLHQPHHPHHGHKQRLQREDSISLSFSDADALNSASVTTATTRTAAEAASCPGRLVKSKTKSFLKQPPHTFMYFNLNAGGDDDDNVDVMKHAVSRRSIPTTMTVIGSPILRQHHDKVNRKNTLDMGGAYGSSNVVWQFGNEKDLICGLSGVHHSRSNPLWIDLVCDRDAFMNIAEHIRPSIHTLTMEDCVSADCREKMEIFHDYVFLCLKTMSNGDAATPSINILVFDTMIITLHDGTPLTADIVHHCRTSLHKKFGNMCPSPAWVCYTILDAVIDRMIPDIESTVREVEVCERFIFGSALSEGETGHMSLNKLLQRMQIARAWMVLYRSRLYPKSTITHNLLNNEFWRKQFLKDVPQPYWADINDHVARMVDLLELGTQTLESVQNVFVAKVSLEMTQKSNNLSMVGDKLARVGAVFMPLTVITGIWGMNCKVPFQFVEDSAVLFTNDHIGFCIILFGMLLAAYATWCFVTRTSQKGQEKKLA